MLARPLAHRLRRRVEIFEFLSLPRQMELVATLDKPHLSALLEEMSSDDRVALLKNMDQAQVELLLPLDRPGRARRHSQAAVVPRAQRGVDHDDRVCLAARGHVTARDALAQLRTQAPDRETIYYVYVIDDARHLHGFVSLRKLFLARPDALVSELMDKDVISVRVDEDQEVVANKIARYDFIAMPVVDDQGRLVGIVTHDDVLDVVQQEATEDVHLHGRRQPPRRRISGHSVFHAGLEAGNLAGAVARGGVRHLGRSQPLQRRDRSTWNGWCGFCRWCWPAAATPVRNRRRSSFAPWPWGSSTARRNFASAAGNWRPGLVLGGTLALLGFVFASRYVPNADAGVVAGTVALVVTFGTVNGTLLPIVLKQLGMDPALMSNPLIASLSDILGV